jgi:hypothetical protein
MSAALAARGRWVALNPLALTAFACLALGIALRLVARPNLPLWLDEAWTGAMVAQDSLRDVLHQTLLDANAPLYFVVMHLSTLVLGISNEALRFPSLMFGALAPLLALVPVKGIPRDARYLWCALMALWIPGIWYSQEARGYTMLLFLMMASAVAYARLLAQPDLRRATLWASIGALCILTHYHAALLLGCQGLAYLGLHRRRAVRTWPAALVFIPAFAWALMHLPHVAEYADPRFTWFDRLALGDIPALVFFMLGDIPVAIGLIGPALIPLLVRAPRSGIAPDENAQPFAWIVVGATALALVLVLIAAALTTSFTFRYLVPFAPGLMLGMAMAATRLGQRWPTIPLAVALVFTVAAVKWTVEGRGKSLKVYNFQIASDALMAADVHNLTIFWDNPLRQIVDRDQLTAIGGFFFRRAGYPMAVEPVSLPPGEDPNARLLATSGARPHSGILWLYDLAVRGTAAKSFPPAIEQRDPAWQCRQFGRDQIGIVACTRP